MTNETALQTPLYQAHLASKAKIVQFAGYQMPIEYPDGMVAEHGWVRGGNVGIFDVSHMGQIWLRGDDVVEKLEILTPSSIADMPILKSKYSVLLESDGGIIDDIIITRFGEKEFMVVINASRKAIDIAHITGTANHLKAQLEQMSRALIAIQGKGSPLVVSKILSCDPNELPYMSAIRTSLKTGEEIILSRSGYTGEDGFEISIANHEAEALWQALLLDPLVAPVGLGARDILRMEVGYPLYGNDLDLDHTPIEASLSWVIDKKRNNYIGSEGVISQMKGGVSCKRVSIKLLDKGIARAGSEIIHGDQVIGLLGSGGFSPILNCGIGQCYLPKELSAIGQEIGVMVRGRQLKAVVSPLSLVKINS